MNWIRTYDFKWINLAFVWEIAYKPVTTIDDEVIGYMILLSTVDGEVEAGCLIEEDDTLDYIDCITHGNYILFDLCSEEEIIEIYNKSKK